MVIGPGTRVGSYVLLEKIGEGGMGAVFRARQESLERDVAIKILPSHLAAEPGFNQRFHREALAIARLRHPSILTVHDFGIDNGVSYLVMEFVKGTTLESKLGQKLPPAEVAELLAPIAAALDHAHANGVLHRDVKPSNIFLTADGRPILGDFGLSRVSGDSGRLTETGLVMGTPAYMAPEQCAGEEPSPQTDIYALATIAYELLSDRLPFIGPTPMRVLASKLTDPPAPPPAAVPADVRAALLKGLAARPEDRYPTATALVEALRPRERRRPWELIALVPAVAGALFLLAAMLLLPQVGAAYLPEIDGSLAADVPADSNQVTLQHNGTTFVLDRSILRPSLGDQTLPAGHLVQLWVDQPTQTQITAINVYDEQDQNPASYTSAEFDEAGTRAANLETEAGASGGLAAFCIVLAAAVFIAIRSLRRARKLK